MNFFIRIVRVMVIRKPRNPARAGLNKDIQYKIISRSPKSWLKQRLIELQGLKDVNVHPNGINATVVRSCYL